MEKNPKSIKNEQSSEIRKNVASGTPEIASGTPEIASGTPEVSSEKKDDFDQQLDDALDRIEGATNTGGVWGRWGKGKKR